MDFDEMMKTLGEQLGMADFKPNQDGSYGISLDGTIMTFVARQGAGLIDVVARLCDLPEEAKPGDILCRTLLAAMASEDGDEAYSFFLSEDRTSVYLRRTAALGVLDGKGLVALLEDFADTLEEWRRAVGDFVNDLDAVADDLADEDGEAPLSGPSEGGLLRI